MINCLGKQSLLQAMIFCQKKLLHQSARSFLHASSIFIQCNRLWSIFIILNINNLEFTTIGVCLAPREPFGIKVKKTERTVYLEIERGSNSITRPHKRTPKTLDHPLGYNGQQLLLLWVNTVSLALNRPGLSKIPVVRIHHSAYVKVKMGAAGARSMSLLSWEWRIRANQDKSWL